MVVPGTLKLTDARPIDADAAADTDLLRRMAAGDVDAHRLLYERHASAVFAFLIARTQDREQAEDVLQDVMIAAWKGAARFRGESAVRTWLLSIAFHKAGHAWRARDRARAAADGQPFIGPGTDSPQPVDAEARLDLAAAVAALPEPQRTVVVLYFYGGQSLEAIGAVLNVPLGTVKSRLHRAKAGLKAALRDGPPRRDRERRGTTSAAVGRETEGSDDVS